jgi:hypothetical protein
VLVSGVITQQLANAPDEHPERGRFVAALPGLSAMFAMHYGAPRRSASTKGRARHEDRR